MLQSVFTFLLISIGIIFNCPSAIKAQGDPPNKDSNCLLSFIPEAAIKKAHCGRNDGYAEIAVFGSIEKYDFAWSNGSTFNYSENLSVGLYYVTIASKILEDCSLVKEIAVGEIGSPKFNVVTTDQTCEDMGALELIKQRGFGKMQVELTSTDFYLNETLSDDYVRYNDLPVGDYMLKISNELGCTDFYAFSISFLEGIELIPSDMTMPDCTKSTGEIELTAVSGNGPFEFCYDLDCYPFQNQDKKVIQNLPAGQYRFSVTDSDGCTGDTLVIIENNENEYPTFSDVSYQHAECSTENGTIRFFGRGHASDYYELFALGNKIPIGYTYGNLAQTWVVSPGRYFIKCTDSDGCQTIPATMHVKRPKHLDFVIDYYNPSGKNGKDGFLELYIVNYDLSELIVQVNGPDLDTLLTTSPTLHGLAAGNYEVSVTYFSRRGLPCAKSLSFELEDENLYVTDLALRKEISNIDACYIGDDIEFVVTIYNQGDVPVTNLTVGDFLPPELEYIDSHHLNSDSWKFDQTEKFITASYSNYLKPAESISLKLKARIIGGIPNEVITNIAEIIGYVDQYGRELMDVDSTPDSDPINDGQPIDNQISDRGDEDDHDIATFTLKEEEKFINLTYEYLGQKIKYRVTNPCNNNCCGLVNIGYFGGPVAVCNSAATAEIQHNTNQAVVSIEDINFGSYHPCDYELDLSFSENAFEDEKHFGCDDLGSQMVVLYARVGSSISQCVSTVEIGDVSNICATEMLSISGEVYTPDFKLVENVMIESEDIGTYDYTDEIGKYAISSLEIDYSCEIKASLDQDYLNGVSTIDLIKIQRHILGIEKFDSPYQLIAADIDRSKSINGLDLVELRKLILGVYSELPKNSSWRFIESGYNFLDDSNPWHDKMGESFFVPSLYKDMNLDFIGVKVGDVDHSASVNSLDDNINSRSQRWPLILEIAGKKLLSGSKNWTRFKVRNYERINGLQGTIEYDPSNLKVTGVSSEIQDVSAANFDLSKAEQGYITFSISDSQPKDLDNHEDLFSLEIVAFKNLDLSEVFKITSGVTSKEAYRGNNEIVPLELAFVSSLDNIIHSVDPNPWSDQTSIKFEINKRGVASWEFYDIRGRLLYRYEDFYEKGKQQFLLAGSDLEMKGVIYIRLRSGNDVSEYQTFRI